MKDRTIAFYKNDLGEPNVAIIRLHNRRIIVNKVNDSIMLSIASICKEPNKPASTHHVVKDLIRVTQISFSLEVMEAISIVMSYMKVFDISPYIIQNESKTKEKEEKTKVQCDICGFIWGHKIDDDSETIKCPNCKQDAYYLKIDE
jgi:Zn finger protein HypA/HybF involved in hydrogenase expression